MESYKNAILRNMFLSRSILFTMCQQKNINYLLQVPNINSITKEHTKFEVTPPRSKLYFLYVSSVRCNRSCNVKTEIKMVRKKMTEKLKKKTNYHFPLINPVLACFFFQTYRTYVFTWLLLPLIPKYLNCHPHHSAPNSHLSKQHKLQFQGYSVERWEKQFSVFKTKNELNNNSQRGFTE